MSLQKHIRIILSIILVTGMVCIAELFQEREIIFPETTAILLGAWTMDKQPWRVDRPTMLILLIIASTAGWIISAFLPIWLFFKILIGLAAGCIMLMVSGCSFYPLISALILPILTNAHSVLYPVSVLALGILIVLGQYLLERKKIRIPSPYQPKTLPLAEQIENWLMIFITIALLSAIACGFHIYYLIAPPLIVTFCEMIPKDSKTRRAPLVILIVLSLCACLGSCVRLLICSLLGWPLTIAALIISCCVFYLMSIFKMSFPPAGAIALLPLMIDTNVLILYPFEVIGGSVVLIGAAVLINTRFRKTIAKKSPRHPRKRPND